MSERHPDTTEAAKQSDPTLTAGGKSWERFNRRRADLRFARFTEMRVRYPGEKLWWTPLKSLKRPPKEIAASGS